MTFAASVCLATVVYFAVRAPAISNGEEVVADIELVGRIRGVVHQTILTIERLSEIKPTTTAAEIELSRERTTAMVEACARLSEQLAQHEESWVPVPSAQRLLDDAKEAGQDALGRCPTVQVDEVTAAAADSTETNPNLTGLNAESRTALQTSANQLRADSDRLLHALESDALDIVAARGTLFGFAARDYLLALLIVSVVVGGIILTKFRRRLQVDPYRMIENDLKLSSQTEPQKAMNRCYSMSASLLKLADQILRGVYSPT